MRESAKTLNSEKSEEKRLAIRAIGGNLSKLRQAMSKQRKYDAYTVKSVTGAARVFLHSGLLDDLSKSEVKRILGAIDKVVG